MRREAAEVAPGRLAVIVTQARVAEITSLLQAAGLAAIDPRKSDTRGLAADLVVLGAESANGLEFDGVVVVEPSEIVRRGAQRDQSETSRGLRTLYVAMTRPTRRIAIVAAQSLPSTLR